MTDRVYELESEFNRTASTICDLFKDHHRAIRRAQLAQAKAEHIAVLIGELEDLQALRRHRIAELPAEARR